MVKPSQQVHKLNNHTIPQSNMLRDPRNLQGLLIGNFLYLRPAR